MSRFDDRYLNYGDVYSIIMQAKTVDQAMNVLYLPYVEIPKWTPVTERLPKRPGYYLTSSEYRNVWSDFFFDGEWEEAERFMYKVTAWMPLPEPYEEGEG